MNFAEKLAGTYLRLNGFLVLPNFTVFGEAQHNHVDLIGFRAPNSKEIVEGKLLPIDGKLFKAISTLWDKRDPTKEPLGIAVEVRTNKKRDVPTESHIRYVGEFLGRVPVWRIAFYEGRHAIELHEDTIHVGLRYAGLWIQRRIDWMLKQKFKLNKTGSWAWSEPFLSDYLAMYQLGLLTDKRD